MGWRGAGRSSGTWSLFMVGIVATAANMYDLIADHKHVDPVLCPAGCGKWTDFNTVASTWWNNKSNAAAFGSSCAQLGRAPVDPHGYGSKGAWCFCANATAAVVSCLDPLNRPTQINLQVAAPKTVVVSFVTFEAAAPAATPVATIGTSENALEPAAGPAVTHIYQTPAQDRTYYMHFVVFSNLSPRTRYYYRVKSGGSGAEWSAIFAFKSGYSSADESADQDLAGTRRGEPRLPRARTAASCC